MGFDSNDLLDLFHSDVPLDEIVIDDGSSWAPVFWGAFFWIVHIWDSWRIRRSMSSPKKRPSLEEKYLTEPLLNTTSGQGDEEESLSMPKV